MNMFIWTLIIIGIIALLVVLAYFGAFLVSHYQNMRMERKWDRITLSNSILDRITWLNKVGLPESASFVAPLFLYVMDTK